jgi:DNA polymerase-1
MIHIDRALREKRLGTRMLLQVHDELVFDAPEAEAEKAIAVLRQVMQGAAEPAVAISVPLTVEARAASNWDEAH